MSLHETLMSRALIHFKNEQGGAFTGLGLNDLWSTVGESIAKKQAEAQAERKAEEQQKKAMETYGRLIGSGARVRMTIDKKGDPSITMYQPDDAEEAYRQESLKIRQENTEQKREEEKRRILTQKLNNARQFGGIIKPDDMQKLNEDIGFDLGTDLNTGRIENTPDGNFRVLSNEEYSKKSDIIKTSKDAESKMNIVLKDIEQMSRIYDQIPLVNTGPIQGRTVGPTAGVFGEENVRALEDMKNGILGSISRGLLQEVGVLTEPDVARAKALLPKLTDTVAVKNRNLKELMQLLKTRTDEFKRRQEASLGSSSNNDVYGGGQSVIRNFTSEAEVEAANLPSGTKITINGRPAVWE